SREEVRELCDLPYADLRPLLTPDLTSIGEAFIRLLERVRGRSHLKGNSLQLAGTRCCECFAGLGRKRVDVRRFARSLHTLSIQWSGYSLDECRALGELLDSDGDGIITVDDFNDALLDWRFLMETGKDTRAIGLTDEEDEWRIEQ
ncbi:unnamed protein product, partial [Chrysoparadoxa australica]